MPQKNTQDLQLVQDQFHSLPHRHSQWITWSWLVEAVVEVITLAVEAEQEVY